MVSKIVVFLLVIVCHVGIASTVLNMAFDADTPPAVVDNSGSGNNGILVGATASVTACFSNGCYEFYGTNNYIEVADSSSLHCANLTISAWVNAVGLDEYPNTNYLQIFSKPGSYSLEVRGAGNMAFSLTGVKNWITSLQNDHALFDGAWHHIIATYDGSTMAIYIDGKLNSSTTGSGSISFGDSNLRIGSIFKGKIDEVRIQNAGISASAALALWQSYGTVRTTPQSYYVSSSGGDDTNDGLSSGSPWKTLTKVYTQEFLPYAFIAGDSILLKRGDTWTNSLATLYLDGSAGSPILIGAYGTGGKPKVYGDGRGIAWTAVNGYTGVYEAVVDAGSRIEWVFEGTNRFGVDPNYHDAANWQTLSPSNFAFPYYMSDRIWVRTTDDGPPTNMCLFGRSPSIYRSSYIMLQDIDFEAVWNGQLENCASITLSNVSCKYSLTSGFHYLYTTNCVLDAATVQTAGESGIYLLSGISNIVRNCIVDGIDTNINGFPSGGGDRGGVGLYEGEENIVEHCKLYNPSGNMSGALDVYYENDSVFRWNYAEGAHGFYPHGNNNLIYGNTFNGKNIGNAGSVEFCPATHLIHNDWGYGRTGVPTNNYMINNTFWNAKGGVGAYPGGVLRNNIFYGNGELITHRTYDLNGVGHAEFADSDYNCFYSLPPYTDTPHFVIWSNWPVASPGEVVYQSFASYKLASGQDAHSMYADPQFISANPITAADLIPSSASLVKGAGIWVFFGLDYAGKAIVNPPTIGAYELGISASATTLRVGTLRMP